jgi:hypothetical protein
VLLAAQISHFLADASGRFQLPQSNGRLPQVRIGANPTLMLTAAKWLIKEAANYRRRGEEEKRTSNV